MRRLPVVIAGLVGAAALPLATAAPASADHYVSPSATGCHAGQLASGTGLSLFTETVTVKQRKDGTTRFICLFRGLPAESSAEDNGYVDWVRPSRATRGTTICAIVRDDTAHFGEGRIQHTPGGTMKVDCLVRHL